MAAKAKAPKAAAKKSNNYKVDGNTVTRTKQFCPKCGPGTFMAVHADRVSCGCCGYTEFTKKD